MKSAGYWKSMKSVGRSMGRFGVDGEVWHGGY